MLCYVILLAVAAENKVLNFDK